MTQPLLFQPETTLRPYKRYLADHGITIAPPDDESPLWFATRGDKMTSGHNEQDAVDALAKLLRLPYPPSVDF